MSTLLAFPNVSEGRDEAVLESVAAAWAPARVLDVHVDADHDRAAFTLAGEPGQLARAVAAGAEEVVRRVRGDGPGGVHPFVGALDVAAIVWPRDELRGAACAEALVLGDELGRRGVPVLLYGALAGGRTRAELRRGGPAQLGRRLAAGELRTDFGPPEPHPTAGVTLVAARPPLVAFNLVVDAPLDRAREVAAELREGGPAGLPGLRALGLPLERAGQVQVSMNVERPDLTPLADILAEVGRRVPVRGGEIIGLVPRTALGGWPEDVPLRGRRVLEDHLDS